MFDMDCLASPIMSKGSTDIWTQMVRYGAVGAFGTGVHFLTMFAAIEILEAGPIFASTTGAALGALVNYSLNHRITFGSNVAHAAAMPRFLLVAAVGLGLNALILGLLLELGGLPVLGAQVVATASAMGLTFVANRMFTF